jgi:hypothetical protein
MKTYEKHYVIFHSPGTFFDETSSREIDSWDTKKAVEMSEQISERYDAKPYGFRFLTNREADPIKDQDGNEMEVAPKKVKDSPMHFLGGKVETYKEIANRNLKDERILLSNMKSNRWWTVITNTNSYKTIRQFDGEDVVVDAKGDIIDRASNYIPEWPEEG